MKFKSCQKSIFQSKINLKKSFESLTQISDIISESQLLHENFMRENLNFWKIKLQNSIAKKNNFVLLNF